MPISFTKYSLSKDRIFIDTGLLVDKAYETDFLVNAFFKMCINGTKSMI